VADHNPPLARRTGMLDAPFGSGTKSDDSERLQTVKSDHFSRLAGDERAAKRILGRFGDDSAGPRMIVLGGIHGNEPAGLEASRRVMASLERDRPAMSGSVVFLAGNLAAIERRARFVHLDLNRQWTIDRILAVLSDGRTAGAPAEHTEQRALLDTLRDLISSSPGPLYFLDLHTSSAAGAPFLTVGDTLRNRRFAQRFPLSLILGLEEQVDGALLELLGNYGFITMGVEAGQHDSPESADVHEAVVWLALAGSGVLGSSAEIELGRYRKLLERARNGLPRVVEVRRRHAINNGDGFRMEQGYRNFQPVRVGEVVAQDRNGPIRAPEGGMILLPLYQGQGDDGFFIAREVHMFWLRLSALLRRMRTRGVLRMLPGVKRDPKRPDVFVVDTRIARWYPLEIFHLFGFRKLRRTGEELTVSRRRYDLAPPSRISFTIPPVN
jgi:predicted deacylase